jgi:hypothetical protein
MLRVASGRGIRRAAPIWQPAGTDRQTLRQVFSRFVYQP